MKITKSQLRKLIKEEVQVILNEEERILNSAGEGQSMKSFALEISDALEDARKPEQVAMALNKVVRAMKNNKGMWREEIQDLTYDLLKKHASSLPKTISNNIGTSAQLFDMLIDRAGL